MKQIVLSVATISLFSTLQAQSPQADDQPWYDLLKEVKYRPAKESSIDSLRRLNNVPKVVKGRSVKNNLPARTLTVHSLGWGQFNAGYAAIEDWRDSQHYYVSGKAVTNKFISGLMGGKYRVRDWVYTVGDVHGLYPHFFEQHIEEGTYRKDRWNVYDHRNKRVYGVDGDNSRSDTLRPFSDNYMSIFYNLRNSPMKTGDTLYFPTFVHEKNWNIKCVVLGREEVTVPAGTFKTVKVQPILVGDGQGFNKKDKMYLWFTDDNRRIMVKGQAKARIGHIYARLHYLEVN